MPATTISGPHSPPAGAAPPAHGGHLDFNLHGLAGVRLVDARQGDAAAVRRQLGPLEGPLANEPDVIVHFVDRLAVSSPLRYAGLGEAAFSDEAFLVLRSRHKTRALVQVPCEQIGRQCRIVCERGLPLVPLLVPIINLSLLAKGVLPLHASAFEFQGTGVLATGWSKGGKTELLLAFASQGARYVGDEWVYLAGDGSRMYGLPEPVRLWDWHLRELPALRGRIGRGARLRLGACRLAARALEACGAGRTGRRSAAGRLASRAAALCNRQAHVDVPPERLFGAAAGLSGVPQLVLFTMSHEQSDIVVGRIDAGEVAQRMAASLAHERQAFMACYHQFRFAFPGRRSEVVEQAAALERELLPRVLAGKPAFAVCHPYPVSLNALFEAVLPLLRS